MKNRILEILRLESAAVSGEELSGSLGVSRVAVWKHIRSLQACGYQIVASNRGYRLEGEPDTPFAWEFPDRHDRLHYFQEVSSTMDPARDLARSGCPAMTVVVADRQQRGRGRLDRRWRSEAGGLYFTVVLRPLLPPALGARAVFCASVSLAQVLNRLHAVDATVKWPNDILVAEGKIAGILSEMEAEADRISYLNIGIGINVNNDATQTNANAVSLRQLLDRKVSRKELLAGFLEDFEQWLENRPVADLLAEYKRCCVTLGRPVEVVTHRDTFRGRAVNIDEAGSLILKTDDGRHRTIHHGDCFHQ